MIKILVADDEPDMETLIRQKFRQKIRDNEYQFAFAENGAVAIQKLKEDQDFDIVLSDINMPEMDGLTLLGKLGEIFPLIKTVMVSAYGDMENIRSAMNKGAFDFVCKPVNFEDLSITIQKTINHVTQIKETLQAIRENNILRMYVDDSVLKFMESKGFTESLHQNEMIVATVVFIDICEFTSISETEDANVVVNLLNDYFEVIVKEIIEQNGTIDKFIGDAVMAVFKGKYHLDRAIECSVAIRDILSKLPAVEGKSQFKPIVSIGINSGEMVSGNIGSATLKRLDYTVIGDTVNIAARLQAGAAKGQIWICENCFEQVKESFDCKEIGEINLKNKSLPVKVYQVLG